MSLRLVTANDLCTGMQAVLVTQLPALLVALGLNEGDGARKAYTAPKRWDQVPDGKALQTANYPAGAIASAGVIPGTTRTSRTGTDATFGVSVAVYDRGPDFNATSDRVRTWAALVRALGLHNPTLGGIASAVRVAGETYRQSPKEVARTHGGCQVDFQVDVRNIADLSDLDGVLPTVLDTFSTVTVRPPQE